MILKPCPFCGAKAMVWRTNHATYIQCERFNGVNGHLVQLKGRTDEEAKRIWNYRGEEDDDGK